jgi:hypothetical protein
MAPASASIVSFMGFPVRENVRLESRGIRVQEAESNGTRDSPVRRMITIGIGQY